MSLGQMNSLVASELSHIPEGDYEFQGQLRMIYRMSRMRSLGKKAIGKETAGEVLQSSLASIRADNPSAKPSYDARFFGIS